MEIEASKTRNVFSIAALAIVLATIFDYLFFDKAVGLSAAVFADDFGS